MEIILNWLNYKVRLFYKYFLTHTNMLNFEKHKDEYKKLYPNYSDKELKYIFELRVEFWEWLIKNYDLFFNKEQLWEQ